MSRPLYRMRTEWPGRRMAALVRRRARPSLPVSGPGQVGLWREGFVRQVGQPLGALLGVVALCEREGDEHFRARPFDGPYGPPLCAEEVADAARPLQLFIEVLLDRQVGLLGWHLPELLHRRLRQVRVKLEGRV